MVQPCPIIIVDDQKENIIGRNILPKVVIALVQETLKPCSSRGTQDAVKVVDLVSATDNPINEAITIDKKNVDVAEEPRTVVTNEQANTPEEHEKQIDEKTNDEINIGTKKADNATEQPTKEVEVHKPARGN